MHVARDDEQLLLELYLARYRRFVALAAALCGSTSAGEDVVQEAYVRLFARPRRLREPAAAEAYLRSVVLNLSRRQRWRADLALVCLTPNTMRSSTGSELSARTSRRTTIGTRC